MWTQQSEKVGSELVSERRLAPSKVSEWPTDWPAVGFMCPGVTCPTQPPAQSGLSKAPPERSGQTGDSLLPPRSSVSWFSGKVPC